MKRVQTKLFRNGGSWAVRIPAEWVGASAEVELVETRPGVVEVHLLSRQSLFDALVAKCRNIPIADADLQIPERQPEADRFDIALLLGERA